MSKSKPNRRQSAGHIALRIEPISVRIPMAVELTGLSRTRIYALIKTRDLETVKVGASTLIPLESLRRLVQKPSDPS